MPRLTGLACSTGAGKHAPGKARNIGSLACSLTAAALVCVTAAAPAAAAGPPTTTNDPARAAAGWLAQQFGDHLNYVGFPGFDGGTTADVIFALAASKTGAAKIAKSITYFQAHVADYTQISDTSGKPGPSDGAVGKTALAALVAGADPTRFGGYNLLRTLKTDQCTSVSAPTSQNDFTTPTCPAVGAARNIYSSISESFAVLAEARGGGKYLPDAAATSYFLSLQCADGGFTSDTVGGKKCGSDIDATGYAVVALVALGGHATQVRRAVHWLDVNRKGKPYWTSNGGPNVDSTGLAAAALAAVGRNTAGARAWLISQQVTTGPTVGGRKASRGALKYQGAFDASASVKATADGMLGLASGASLATLTSTGATAGTAVLALAAPKVAKPSVAPNGTQTITGFGFQASELVRATSPAGVILSRADADTKGTVTLRFAVSAATPAGTQTVTLTGARSGLSSQVSYELRVNPAAPPVSGPGATATASSSAPQLADTGRNGQAIGAEVLIGLACLLIGGLATIAGRRRTR